VYVAAHEKADSFSFSIGSDLCRRRAFHQSGACPTGIAETTERLVFVGFRNGSAIGGCH
jgi:hypothetical protein